MRKKKTVPKTKSSAELSSDDRVLIESLIQSLETMDKDTIPGRHLSPEVVAAFVKRIPLESSRAPEILDGIGRAYPQKEVRKAVRTSLFRLKQKGVVFPDVNWEEAPAFQLQKVQQDNPEAYVGPVDGEGSRAVLISIPQLPQGTGLGVGLINEEKGFLEYSYGRYSKRQAKEMETLIFEKLPFMVETSLGHATALLEDAHRLSAERGDPSGDYHQVRNWLLEHVQRLDKPPVYEIIPPESGSIGGLTDSQIERLLAHPLLAGWIAQPDKLKSVAEELARAEESPILLSGVQKAERVNQIKEDSIRHLFPEHQRNLMKQRLEEMGYLFWKLGEENLARISVLCALSFLEKDSVLKVNAFLKGIMEKSLFLYFSEAGSPAPSGGHGPRPSSGIVVP